MSGTSAKLSYCFVLLVLAVFVAMPPRAAQPVLRAEVTVAPMSTEARLAKAIHERIAIEVAGIVQPRELSQLEAEENGLRDLAFADDAQGARRELIDCLADELSAAINREVRGVAV